MKLLRLCSILFFSCFTLIANATPATDLTSLLNSVRSMRSDFTQTVYDNHGKVAQVSTGKLALERPGKFRWEVKKPIPQTLIANQSRLWIYDPDLQQVTIRSLKKAAGDTPALLLSHETVDINRDYTVKEKPSKDGLRWFLLVPKKSDNMFEAIQMGFSAGNINQMRLQDHLGHTTGIKFSNTETNVNLSANLFSFTPPADVDVIDETARKR